MKARLPGLRALTAIAATAALFAMAGCASDSNTTPEKPGTSSEAPGNNGGELKPINIGAMPIANFAYLYLGIEKGFFEEEGLDPQVKVAGTGNELVAGAVSGAYDVIGAGYVPVFTAVGSGLPLKIIASADVGGDTIEGDWTPVGVSANSSIKTPEDLAKSTVAVNALKGVLEVTLRAAFDKLGIDDSQMKLTEVPFPDMPAAVEKGTVDAAYAPEPFLQQIKDAGGHTAFSPYATLGKDFPNGGWQATDSTIAKDTELIDAFIRAINKSTAYAASHPDEVRATLPTFTKIPAETAEKMNLPVFTPNLDEAALEELLQYTAKFGVIDKMPKLSDMLYTPAG